MCETFCHINQTITTCTYMNKQDKLEYFKNRGYVYDAITGNITSPKGTLCRIIDRNGYIRIWSSTKGKKFYIKGHILAWYLHYNESPPNLIDHVNRVKSDNRIGNLVSSNKILNGLNNDAKGCSWLSDRNKWRAELMYNGMNNIIGYYDTYDEAHSAYLHFKNSIKKNIPK